MKKLYLFLMGALLLTGCTINLGSSKIVTAKIINTDFSVNSANKYWPGEVQIVNNLDITIYTESMNCGNPLKTIQLPEQNNSKSEVDEVASCVGITTIADRPMIINSGSKQVFKQNVSEPGNYKFKFVYYLSEEDFTQRTNPQSIYTEDFSVNRTDATIQTVIDTCNAKDSRKGRFEECLYIAAKNSAAENLDLALNLCGEIDKRKYSFDGCYDGVALMLQRAKLPEKAVMVCGNYQNTKRKQECVDIINR